MYIYIYINIHKDAINPTNDSKCGISYGGSTATGLPFLALSPSSKAFQLPRFIIASSRKPW